MTKTLKTLLIILGVVVIGGFGVLAFQNLTLTEKPIINEQIIDETEEEHSDELSSHCNDLPFYDNEDFDNYKNQVANYVFQPDKEELNNYSIKEKLEVSGLSKKGRIGDIIKFNNLIACGYFDGLDSYIVIEDAQEKVLFKQVDNNQIQVEGQGRDFYPLKFSPNGKFLIYKENLYAGWKLKMYDLNKEKVLKDFLWPESYGFTLDENYFYVCSDTDYHGNRYAMIYSVSDFNIHYNLAEEKIIKEEYENLYQIQCQYNEDKNTVIFLLTERHKDDGKQKVVEYLIDSSEAREIK